MNLSGLPHGVSVPYYLRVSRQPEAVMVLTTIYDAVILDTYFENFQKFGRLDAVDVIVIPDRKTPAAAYQRCADLARKGMRLACPSIDEQEAFLRRAGMRPDAIPYNSDNRRNVGYLMAYASGAGLLISIDDDNYCRPEEDFIGEHAIVCNPDPTAQLVDSDNGFFNICDLLEMDCPGPVYARGFPYRFRHQQGQADSVRRRQTGAPIHINAGLWVLDPDIDGITWLVLNPRVRSFKGESVVLGRDTWSPVNSQNTALRLEAVPSYYFVRMGYPLEGMPIDRYGDIFSGYFAQACARHLGGHVRAGTPVADHRRNSHNYMRDATAEWACIRILEDLVPWLMQLKLEGSTYSETYRALSHALDDIVETMRGSVWNSASQAFFHEMTHHMRHWLDGCAVLR